MIKKIVEPAGGNWGIAPVGQILHLAGKDVGINGKRGLVAGSGCRGGLDMVVEKDGEIGTWTRQGITLGKSQGLRGRSGSDGGERHRGGRGEGRGGRGGPERGAGIKDKHQKKGGEGQINDWKLAGHKAIIRGNELFSGDDFGRSGGVYGVFADFLDGAFGNGFRVDGSIADGICKKL